MAIFSMANGAVVHETHVVVSGTWVEPFHVNGILYVIICHLRGSVKIKLNAADRLLSKYLKVLVMEITFVKLLFSGILWYREKKSFMCMYMYVWLNIYANHGISFPLRLVLKTRRHAIPK